MNSAIFLSFVMPCLNEARTIAACIHIAQQTISEIGITGEVVIADNGSSDGSADIARAAGAHVVLVPTRGYGAALKAGFEAARGTYIIMGDADLSYDFSTDSVRRYLAALEEGAALVMGNRFKGGIAKGAMPPLHRIGTPLMSLAFNILFGTRIGDINCGLRGFRRDAIQALGLQSSGMEFASEMIVRCATARLPLREIPTTLAVDGRDRKPHLRSFRDGFRHVSLWLKFLPAHYARAFS